MNERYVKLFSMPAGLYAEGAPVIIAAGILTGDQQTGSVFAQIKYRNISPKTVRALTVVIRALDTAGRPIEGEATKEYLDLAAPQGAEFGAPVPIPLPNESTRGFAAEVREVIFADSSIWDGSQCGAWELLPAPESLEQALGDPELLRQFRLHFGERCTTVPRAHKDLWRCACGAWNRGEACCSCGNRKSALFGLDFGVLNAEKNARLAQEQAARAAKDAAAKTKKKTLKTVLAIAIPLLVLCLATVLTFTVILPSVRYHKAEELMEDGEYEQAAAAFGRLGDFRDSKRQKKAALYEQALDLLKAGKYDEAAEIFEDLKGYKDSAEQMKAAKKAARTARAEAILSGQHYVKNDVIAGSDTDSYSIDMQLFADGTMNYQYSIKYEGEYSYTYVYQDCRYEFAGVTDDGMILISVSAASYSVSYEYEDGYKDSFSGYARSFYWLLSLDENDQIDNFFDADVYFCEEGENVPAANEEFIDYRVFINSDGEIWKVEKIGG